MMMSLMGRQKIGMFDESTKKTILDVAKYVSIFNVIAAVILFLFIPEPLPLFLGLIFGSLATLLMFLELAVTIEKAVKMEKDRAKAYTASKYYLRVLIYGVVIFISIKASFINVIGTVIGLLSVKVVIYITNIIVQKNSKRKEE